MADLSKIKIGYVMTGSFCTFNKSFLQAEELIKSGADLLPVMSYNAAEIDTRFGNAKDNIKKLEEITGKEVIKTRVSITEGSCPCDKELRQLQPVQPVHGLFPILPEWHTNSMPYFVP